MGLPPNETPTAYEIRTIHEHRFATAAALLAMAGAGADPIVRSRSGEPVSWRPGENASAPKPIEHYVDKWWRHRHTGQVRCVWGVHRGMVVWSRFGTALNPAPIWKALKWLRNAEDVTP